MKKISKWAKQHQWASRIIIILSFVVLIILGVVTGKLLTSLSISIPVFVMTGLVLMTFAGFIFYPSRSLRYKKLSASTFYIRQKICDLILTGSTFFITIYLSNHQNSLFQNASLLNATVSVVNIIPKDSSIKSFKSIAEFSASMKDVNGNPLKWKERKKLLKEQVRAIKRSNEPSATGKTFLVVLSVLVALLLIGLVAALACSVGCSGSVAGAYIIAILGTGLIVFLLVGVIRKLNRQNKKKPTEKE